MLPKEFIKEIERLLTENFKDYFMTKSRNYFTITKDDCEFEAIRTECSYKICLETSDLHYYCHEVSLCGLGNFIDTFQDCIFKDHFEDTIICLMNVLTYKQNRLKRQFREIGKNITWEIDKNVK